MNYYQMNSHYFQVLANGNTNDTAAASITALSGKNRIVLISAALVCAIALDMDMDNKLLSSTHFVCRTMLQLNISFGAKYSHH